MRRALLLALAVAACSPRPADGPADGGGGPAVFFAGEEKGYLEPCG